MAPGCASCFSTRLRAPRSSEPRSVRTPKTERDRVTERGALSAVTVSSSPVPSTKSGSSALASPVTVDEPLLSDPDFAVFPKSVQVARLPLVIFDDEVEEQRIWEEGSVNNGVVSHGPGPPDIKVKNPVVMSNAFKGFVVQPYELRYLHYRNVGIVFARPPGGRFMQPSIDTVLVCRGLVDCLQSFKTVTRLIDVGSGSGFIGKFAGHYAQGPSELEVTLVDIDPTAISYYKNRTFNSESATMTGRPIDWKFCAEDAVSLLDHDSAFDLIVSNPPYIPTKSEASGSLSPLSGGFWEGVGLVVYLLKLISQRAASGARLVLMITSLTLKAPAILEALETVVKKGCRMKILLEREIAWKAWYAGPHSLDHLLATEKESRYPHQVAGCEFFIGATAPGSSRTGKDGRDQMFGYHWHVAYVLEIQAC
ncbi:unnamed protein product [Durusdinium trenchii]|uniref:Methyltransferase small domain-containing protein n=2 Tax=Durusdinium trenchii TaxID=1381693 RepID=A0ABP0Q289_9DINO